METYTSAIKPLLIYLKLFGIHFRSENDVKFRFKTVFNWAKFMHWVILLFFVGYFCAGFSIPKVNISQIMFYILISALVTEAVFCRLVIDMSRTDLVQMIKATDQLMRRFHGKEQDFLKKLGILLRLMIFPLTFFLAFTVFVMATKVDYWFFQVTGLYNETMPTVIYYVYVVTAGTSYALAGVWTRVVESLVITHIFNLKVIFLLLDQMFLDIFNGGPQVNNGAILNFVSLHRNACQVVHLSNFVMRKILFLLFIMKSVVPLFNLLEFIINERQSALLNSLLAILNISSQILMAASVNRMVVKSLEKLNCLVKFGCPSNVSKKLSVKLELYAIHVQLWQPYLDTYFLPKLTTYHVIKTMDFILTYSLFVDKLNEDGD
ncbi:hypothetical protein CHUAL_008535 [Chamberlinius hualienensis]